MAVWYCSVGSSAVGLEGRVVWSLRRLNDKLVYLYALISLFIISFFIISLSFATPFPMHIYILIIALPLLIMIIVMSVVLSTKVKVMENGLIIETGGGDVITIPKDEVKSKNILCIEKTGWGTRLRIWHKSIDRPLPISKGQYDALINALREHWNWTPPEC